MEPIRNDHNVYILGAGFSVDAGLPTMQNFLTRMRDAHPWLESQWRKSEADSIDKVLAFRLRAMAAGYWTPIDLENLEELFSLASAESSDLASHMQIAIAATLDYCVKTYEYATKKLTANGTSHFELQRCFPWLGEPSREHPIGEFSVSPYSIYVASLLGMMNDRGGKPKGDNTFITFNYDTVLENSLTVLGVDFDYRISEFSAELANTARAKSDDKAVKVLKLHGSVNWQYRKSSDDLGGGGMLLIHGDYEDTRGSTTPPQLIPPTWRKDFSYEMEDVWMEAIKSIRFATRIVVIGFSMPPNDVHFRYLISAGLKDNISLRRVFFIDPGNNIKERAAAIFRPEHIDSGKITFNQQRLEAYRGSHSNPVDIERPRIGKGTQFQIY